MDEDEDRPERPRLSPALCAEPWKCVFRLRTVSSSRLMARRPSPSSSWSSTVRSSVDLPLPDQPVKKSTRFRRCRGPIAAHESRHLGADPDPLRPRAEAVCTCRRTPRLLSAGATRRPCLYWAPARAPPPRGCAPAFLRPAYRHHRQPKADDSRSGSPGVPTAPRQTSSRARSPPPRARPTPTNGPSAWRSSTCSTTACERRAPRLAGDDTVTAQSPSRSAPSEHLRGRGPERRVSLTCTSS